MKKIILLFLILTSWSIAQNAFTSPMATNNDTVITNRTWLFGQTDTTKGQNIKTYSNIVVGLMTTDTVSLIVKYQLSLDNTNWTALTTLDSLRQTTGVCTTKAVNCSTIAIGMPFIRFVFSFTKSNVYGGVTYASTLRKYWATIKTI